MTKMIEVEHLSKVYGSTKAIEDVAFTVEKGEIVGFLGPNGAGKTTTMRILAGSLPATTGTARIGGYDVHEQSMEVKKRIGYLPENPPLYLDMTVQGYLHFVAQIKGVRAGDRSTRVKWAIAKCQLEEKSGVIIRKLSKGYRQRVGIAQALVHNPDVIILDEPTVGLDPLQIIEVRHLIRSLAGDHTIILSTHILPEVSMTCDRVTIINRGKVVVTNSLEQLMQDLSGTFGYEVEIEGDATPLLSLLKAVPGVSGINQQESLQPSRSKLQIHCLPHAEPGAQIAALIIAEGFSLHELRRSRPTLEDVFLELTTAETVNPEFP